MMSQMALSLKKVLLMYIPTKAPMVAPERALAIQGILLVSDIWLIFIL
jgi:hypothetical protein